MPTIQPALASHEPNSSSNKPVGRAGTGKFPTMGFRADPTIRASILGWAQGQPEFLTVSEAIRRLVELGLTVQAKPTQSHAD